ncbi:hypothetical protein, partial [Caballeronia sp. GAFFF2]|uniref:hypothetical protein n=1 Tax=Caballeronia sp. GAFFF2 TaxID=2921741 RepID=UPI002028FB76
YLAADLKVVTTSYGRKNKSILNMLEDEEMKSHLKRKQLHIDLSTFFFTFLFILFYLSKM